VFYAITAKNFTILAKFYVIPKGSSTVSRIINMKKESYGMTLLEIKLFAVIGCAMNTPR
jgi:hypothetical protein